MMKGPYTVACRAEDVATNDVETESQNDVEIESPDLLDRIRREAVHESLA